MGLSLSKNICAKSDGVDQSLTPNGVERILNSDGVKQVLTTTVSKISDNIQKTLYKEINITTENTDSVVFSIIEKIKSRADVGMEKYKTNLDRQDLSTVDWIIHAQEELMDAILYLEKLKQIKKIESKDLSSILRTESKDPAFMITSDTKPSEPPSYIYDTSDDYFSNFVGNIISTTMDPTTPGVSRPQSLVVEPRSGSDPTAPLLDISNISVNFIDVVE